MSSAPDPSPADRPPPSGPSAAATERAAALDLLKLEAIRDAARAAGLTPKAKWGRARLIAETVAAELDALGEPDLEPVVEPEPKGARGPLPEEVRTPRLDGKDGERCRRAACQSRDTVITKSHPQILGLHPGFLDLTKRGRVPKPKRVQRRYHLCRTCGHRWRTETPRTDPGSAPAIASGRRP
jgi:hypothetical protein